MVQGTYVFLKQVSNTVVSSINKLYSFIFEYVLFIELDTSTLYLASSSLSYCRISNCATGVLYYYTSISLNVPTNGYYTIKSSSLLDTYGYIYNNSFYSYAPTVYLLEQNDDGAGNKQFLLNMFFDASMSYIMIVTTYDPNKVGSFEIVVTGPDSMYFLDISTTYTCKELQFN